MKRFVAVLNYNNSTAYINVEADTMAVQESILYAYQGETLVAVIDMGALTEAHLTEVAEKAQGKDGKA